MSVCVDLTCVDNWQFSDNLVGWSISSYCKSQQDRIETDASMMGRAEVKTTGLDTNDCWSIEIMHWKSRDERKWRSLTCWPGSVRGYGVREKEPDEKMGPVWCHRADLPLTSKGGGWWLGTSVMPGDQSWVTRVSRLGELETPGAGRAPTCGYWWLQGDQRLGELQLGPSCVGSIFPPQSGWEGDGAQLLLLPGSTVPELPNILLITSSCRTDGWWAS